MAAITGILYVGCAAAFGDANWFILSGAVVSPYIVGGVALTNMAALFRSLATTTADAPQKAAAKATPSPQQDSITSVDIVIYAADQASNPAAVAPFMDDVRIITSRLSRGGNLTAGDEQRLAKVYLRLEKYLVHDEPIRTFSAPALRKHISDALGLDASRAAHTFWPHLSKTSD